MRRVAIQQNTRREDILRVAVRLFRSRGYHGTRMDDVADSAGVNKATVYYYFSSKAEILYAIYLKATSETLEILEAANDDDLPPSEALRRNAELQLRLIARDLDQAAVYFQEAPFIEEWLSAEQVSEIRGRERRFERGIRRIINRGFKDGSFAGPDPAIVTVAYVGMTSWFYRWYNPDRTGKPEKIAATFADVFLRGILSPDAPERSR
jgi:AcrR family transcriptional regulator